MILLSSKDSEALKIGPLPEDDMLIVFPVTLGISQYFFYHTTIMVI